MSTYEKNKTCCFIGHRKINETDKLKAVLYSVVNDLIVRKDVCTFLFGSKSRFDELCYSVVTKLKEKHTHINRVYVRAEYPHINEEYHSYLSEKYEDTYYPEHIINAGKVAYIERNYEMINRSEYCICCYDENYTPPRSRDNRQPKSGTKTAYEYAVRHCGHVINVFMPEQQRL